jgi:superfamily I DNA/RNA helicase
VLDYHDLLLEERATGAGVVGDNAQPIYGFRAANERNVADFPSWFLLIQK